VGAWNFVGRVGGLAVALGVGAAVFNYSAVASADTAGAGSEASSARSATSSAAASPSGRRGHSGASSSRAVSRTEAASPVSRPGANSAPPISAAPPRASIALPPVEDTTNPIPDALDDIPAVASPASAAAKRSAPAAAVEVPTELPRTELPVASVPALEPAPATGDVTALDDPAADPFADGGPTAPVGSPLEWTVLAYTRRELSDLSLTTTVPAAVPRAAAVEAVPVPPFTVETNICTASSQTCTLIMGPSGVPIPSSDYVDRVMWYFTPYAPDDTTAQVVFTPEGLYPITGVKSLPLDTSVDQGLTILSDTLALVPDGMPTAVFGYSQSSIISSLLQDGYQTPGSPYPKPEVPTGLEDSITFVVIANEVNPNGGFLSRFPDLNLPALGIPFYGAAPEDEYPTISYAREYDGFADYPRYPMNFLSVLNAALGIVYVHTQYVPNPEKCTSFCLTKEEVEDAIALPTTDPTQQYYFIPTENLPLLQPIRGIPLIGNPIADLIQPVLKVIVDLGYADWAHGFGSEADQPDANVLVPFGVFPDVNPLEVIEKLVAGVQQGISDFIADFGPNGSIAKEIAAISLPTLSFALPTPDGLIEAVQHFVLKSAEWVSGAAGAIYEALLPTADVINSIVTVLPAYNVDLFLEGVKQMLGGDLIGGLVNAIGLPLAADVGLITTAGLVAALAWLEAAQDIVELTKNIFESA